MEAQRTPYAYASGQLVLLDSLPEDIRLAEGEGNLFLLSLTANGQPAERTFLAALGPGDMLVCEPRLCHDGVSHALAFVATGAVRAQPDAQKPEEWLRCIREGVSKAAGIRPTGNAVSALLVELITAEQAQKNARHERLEKNRQLTAEAMRRKLDKLQGLCGTREDETQTGVHQDPLELALYRIASEYRLRIQEKDINVLRADEALSSEERTRNFAVSANWRMRTVQLPSDWRKHSALPLLAFAKEDGAPLVVYLKAGSPTYWDPALGGKPRPLTSAIAAGLAPEARCFYEPFPSENISRKTLLKFIFATARKAVATIFCIGLVSALVGLVMPVATQYVTGKIIPTGNLPELWQLAILLVVLTSCQITLGVVPSLVMMLFGAQQYERFQAAMFDHILRIPVAAFQTCDSGDMTQRILGATHVQSTVFSIISGQFLGSVFSLVSLGMMFYYSPVLAGVGAALVLLYAVTFFLLARINLGPLTVQAAASGRISGLMKQFFDGMTKIRGAGAEQQVIARFLDDFSLLSRNAFVIERNSAILDAVTAIFPMLVSVLFYGLAGGFLDKNLPLPVFLAFMAAFQSFQGGVMGISSGCWSLLAIEPDIQRFMPLLAMKPEDEGERTPPGKLDGSVTISHLSFRYKPDGPLVLDNVSLKAEPGEFIAIVGPSGSGKSSLVRLLLGFEQPESGGIYYSGKSLANLDLRAVRRQLGVILQNSKVLPGSILENITTGTGHSLDDAQEALRLAAFEEEVEAMPMKIHTLVTPETVSGGQQQRILIARALVGAPAIVIMDESTSALDNITQDIVTSNMEQQRMTRIVIAHRLSTITRADRIYVLENGRICQSGSYAELRAADGLFQRLAERQLTSTETTVGP